MYDAIFRTGISDSRAGHLFHVSSTTVSQWKQEDPGFAAFLEFARDAFAAPELRKFCDGPARNARHGVRKSMWLLEYSYPEKWGRRRHCNPASESESLDPFQQSKDTTICSETRQRTSPAGCAINPPLTRSVKDEPVAISPSPTNSSDQAPAGENSEHGTLNPERRIRKRSPGRPTLLTEEIADAMYEAILHTGISDSRAGSLLNVSRVTICRWKQEDPIFAQFLEIARSKFQFNQITKLRKAPVESAQQGARNARWLLEYTNPERLGRRPRKLPVSAAPSRRRRTSQSESPHPFQQSKHTTICSEISAVSAAPNPEHVTQNSKQQSFPNICEDRGGIGNLRINRPLTSVLPEYNPESQTSCAQKIRAVPPMREKQQSFPNICEDRGAIGNLRINRPLTSVLPKYNPELEIPKAEFPVAPFSLFAFRLPLFLHPSQQSKHTTICSEISAVSAIEKSEHETENSKPGTAEPSVAAPNSEHEIRNSKQQSFPNICEDRGGIGNLRINRPLTSVLAKYIPELEIPKAEFPGAPFSLFAFRLPLFLHPVPTE